MKEFEDLQNLWDKQKGAAINASSEEIIRKAASALQKIRQKHGWAIVVLCTTTAILVTYFLWFEIYRLRLFSLGLGLMAGTLILRSAVEWWSRNRLDNIKPDLALLEFTEKMQAFYAWRKKIHFVLTPVLYVLYFAGFAIAVPEIKPYVSTGMYWYIMVSGGLVCAVLAFYIRKEIKREMQTLTFLKEVK